MCHSKLLASVGLAFFVSAVACSSSNEPAGPSDFAGTGGTAPAGSSGTSGTGGTDPVPGTGGNHSADSGSVGGSGGGSAEGGAAGASSGTAGAEGDPPDASVAAGQLTAAEWDDNLNYDFFESFVDSAGQLYGSNGALHSSDRVILKVTTEQGGPVANANVTIMCDGVAKVAARTATDGRFLFFPSHDGCGSAADIKATATPPSGAPGLPATIQGTQESEWAIQLPQAVPTPAQSLDLAFLVDTTGSMSDELAYLKAEMKSIADAVAAATNNEFPVRYGLVIYRDDGDEYVTKKWDFTTDLSAYQDALSQQVANGGGDMEEAVHQALAVTNSLSWSQGNAARVVFHIADAPPHGVFQESYLAQVDQARLSGIKLFPVVASGADDRTEYLYRMAAQWTLARYLWLTNDAGIGGSHQEPKLPCFQVQHLNKLMIRLLLSELTGQYAPPDPKDVIRSGGDPVDGVCTLDDGGTLRLW